MKYGENDKLHYLVQIIPIVTGQAYPRTTKMAGDILKQPSPLFFGQVCLTYISSILSTSTVQTVLTLDYLIPQLYVIESQKSVRPRPIEWMNR